MFFSPDLLALLLKLTGHRITRFGADSVLMSQGEKWGEGS